jgi:hypothetical protein
MRSGVIDPVVKYADTIRVSVGYVSCASRKSDFSWLAITGFPTKDLIERGIVTPNTLRQAVSSAETWGVDHLRQALNFLGETEAVIFLWRGRPELGPENGVSSKLTGLPGLVFAYAFNGM